MSSARRWISLRQTRADAARPTSGRHPPDAPAAALLRVGRLVAFPTETVYGLGADARSAAAVARIYAAKGRPRFNPLIAHVRRPRRRAWRRAYSTAGRGACRGLLARTADARRAGRAGVHASATWPAPG